jgi:hypothetical protein
MIDEMDDMRVSTNAGDIVVTSERLQRMIALIVTLPQLVDEAPKGKVELNFAGQQVRRSISVSDI